MLYSTVVIVFTAAIDNTAYYQTPKEFPGWLRDLHRQYDFDTILCFGDCRPLHKEAKRWAKSKGIRFLAFEEGYLRPQFITVEEGGVNAYSSLPRDPDFYRKLPELPAPHVENLKPSTMKRIGHAMWYYLMGWHYRHEFPRYRHHKSFSPGMRLVAGFVHTGASNFTR